MFAKNRSIMLVIIASVMVAAALTSCSKNSTTTASTVGVVTESTLTNTVDSSGSIQANQIATLAWSTSGVVSAVNVSTGDKVSSGETIVELDSTTVPAEVIQGYVDLANAKLALETAKSDQSTAEAAVTLANAQEVYDTALGNSWTIGRQIGSVNSVEAAELTLEIAKVTLEKATKRVDKLSYLQDDDLAKLNAQQAMVNAAQNVKTLTVQLSYLKSTPDANSTATMNANLELAKAQLDAAQRAYDRVKNGPNADDIAMAQANVDAAQATVNKMKIIAPFNGEVVVLYDQAGDQVEINDQSVILVDRNKMYVEVSIDETSISNIKVGDSATVSFDAFPGLDTTGKVTFINPIGSSTSGVVNYTVRIDLDKADPSILIGATATVTIQVGKPQTTLFVPIIAVQSDAQGEYVMRITNSGQERVTVVSGQIVNDTVVVKGDLKAGDKVALSSSSSSTSSTQTSNSSRNQDGGGMPGGGMIIPGG